MFLIVCNRPEAAAETLVESYKCKILVADGVAHTHLCVEIAALSVEHVDIVYYSHVVLGIRESGVFAGRFEELAAALGSLTCKAEVESGIIDLMEGCENTFLIAQTGLLVLCNGSLVAAMLAAEIENSTRYLADRKSVV